MSSSGGTSPGTVLKKQCEARLRSLAPQDEPILAVGTAEELPSLGFDLGSGAGWTFIVVTQHRLLFANWGFPESPHQDLRFGDVSSWASGSQYNRAVIALTHRPMSRRQRVPAYRIFGFQWGERDAEVTRTDTFLRFSRPDTQVAEALHRILSERQLPHRALEFPERSRAERTRGSHVLVRPHRD